MKKVKRRVHLSFCPEERHQRKAEKSLRLERSSERAVFEMEAVLLVGLGANAIEDPPPTYRFGSAAPAYFFILRNCLMEIQVPYILEGVLVATLKNKYEETGESNCSNTFYLTKYLFNM